MVLLFEHQIYHRNLSKNLNYIHHFCFRSIKFLNLFVMNVLVLFLYEQIQQPIYLVHFDQYHIFHQNLWKNLKNIHYFCFHNIKFLNLFVMNVFLLVLYNQIQLQIYPSHVHQYHVHHRNLF